MLTSMDPSETPHFCMFQLFCFFDPVFHHSQFNLFLFPSELAKGLGDKGLIDFSQVKYVILKSMYFPSITTLTVSLTSIFFLNVSNY